MVMIIADLKDIATIKNKLISKYINNDKIYECLRNNDKKITEPEQLINTHVMPYFYNLGVEKVEKTYIFIRVYAPRLNNRVIEKFALDIGIGCHKSLMEYQGMTRIDYLLPIIDKLTSSYNKEVAQDFPQDNYYAIGIDKITLQSVMPFSLYDADYDGYILSYTIDMLDDGYCDD